MKMLCVTILAIVTPLVTSKTYFMEDKCGDTIKIDAYHQHFGRIKQTRLSKYRPNTQCVVQVKTAVGRRFVVVFRDIDIEYEPTCDDDYLQIFDGNTTSSPILEGLKKKLCGVKKPPGYYTSSSNEITFLFQSDVWSNEDGFEVLLTTFHEGPCGEEEFRCTNGRCINERLTCDGMNNCGDHSDECNLSPSVVLGIVSSVILITILGIGIILYIRRYGKRKSREKNKKMNDIISYLHTSGPLSGRASVESHLPHIYPEDFVYHYSGGGQGKEKGHWESVRSHRESTHSNGIDQNQEPSCNHKGNKTEEIVQGASA